MKPSKADIREQIAQLEREDQRSQLESLGSRGLAWLALAPAWTEDLAQKAHFPFGQGGMGGFLELAEAQGLCERGDIEYDGEFWIRRSERGSTLEMLKAREGSDFLGEEASRAGLGIRKVVDQVPVSPPVLRWAELASRLESIWGAADWFESVVFSLLDLGRTGEVISWLDTAAPLASVFGGRLEMAVRLGNRRLELAYRRRQDERHIEHFKRRDEQIDAFRYLLDNDDGIWALHYLGVGGVGKTVLLRYITAREAPSLKAPTARIDFDYINPDYPARRPGQLLIELVTELLAYGLDQRDIANFANIAARLHEVLSQEGMASDPLSSLEEHAELYESMIEAFCRIVVRLSAGGRPVVLILDTCEELAKYQPPGSRLPSVEATFKILEDVQRICQKLVGSRGLPFRVVFAGRRPLAQSGHLWALKPYQAGGKRHLLPETKEYLALHELRGFDHRETKDFLCRILEVEIPSWAAYKAILANSREAGRSADISHSGYRPPRRRFRYNPFDLALYGGWLKAEPGLSAGRIASGAQDPYIEYRILERLRLRDLEDLLPALVLLGRFDETVLAPLIQQRPGADFRAVYRELGDQEWIDYQHDEALQTTFLTIDTNLLPRLRSYYGCDGAHEPGLERGDLEKAARGDPEKAARGDQLKAARRTLARILKGLIEDEERQLTDLAPDYIDAALRVLPADEAAHLWDGIERRIPREAGWSWARRVVGRILGEEGAVNSPSHPLWAAVQATLAAAQLHLEGGPEIGPLWQVVLEAVPNHPLAEIRQRLERRACLGLLAARPLRGEPSSEKEIARLLDIAEASLGVAEAQEGQAFHDRQLAASATAALAQTLDSVEVHRGRFSDPARLYAWAQGLQETDHPAEVAAFALMLAGRAWLLAGRPEEGRRLLDRAASMGGSLNGLAPGRWFDWVPPADLASRLRLEAVRALPPGVDPGGEEHLRVWFMDALEAGDIDDVDRERLLAALLSRELARRPLPVEDLKGVTARLSYDPGRRPVCLAHERTPPLVLALARGYLALGEADHGLDLLTRHRAGATASGQDPFTLQASGTGIVEIVRRMRLQRERALFDQWVAADETDAGAAAWPAAVLSGLKRGIDLPRPQGPMPSLRRLLAWIECQSTPDIPAELLNALPESLSRWSSSYLAGVSASAGMPDWPELDYEEAALALHLARHPTELSLLDVAGWLDNHPGQDEQALRLAYKAEILSGMEGISHLGQVLVPLRRRAELALEEGELLALSRPANATFVLDLAVDGFEQAGDRAGAFIAATCRALAGVRAGEEPAARQAPLLPSVLPAYSEIAGSAGWPEWQEIDDLVTSAGGTDPRVAPAWEPWFARFLICWSHARGTLSALQARSLTTLYISGLPDEMVLPEVAKRPEMPTPGLWRRIVSWLGEWWPLLAGFAIIGGLLVGGYLAFVWLLEQVGVTSALGSLLGMGATLPVWLRLVLYVLALIVLVLLLVNARRIGRALTRPLRSWLASRTLATLSLRPELPGLSASLELELDGLALRLGRAFPFVLQPVQAKISGRTVLPEGDAYRDAAPRLAAEVVAALDKLRQTLGRRSLALPLLVGDSRLQAPAWEGILAYALAAEEELAHLPLETLRLWRQAPTSAPRSPWLEAGWQLGLVRIVSSTSSAYLVEEGWRKAGAEVLNRPSLGGDQGFDRKASSLRMGLQVPARATLREIVAGWFDPDELRGLCAELRIEADRLSGDPDELNDRFVGYLFRRRRTAEALAQMQRLRPEREAPYRVLHLVGAPVATGDGLQWQVASAAHIEASYEQVSEAVSGRAGELFAADRVPVQLAPLILLQAEPREGLESRSAFDREDAGELRTYAKKLITAGAEAVLVLPALPARMVPDVIGVVAEALGGTKVPDRNRLLATAEATRRAIATTENVADGTARKLAREVAHLPASTPGVVGALSQAGDSGAGRYDFEELALDVCLFMRPEPEADRAGAGDKRAA